MRRDLINEIGVDADDVAEEIIKKTNFDKKVYFYIKRP